MLRETPFSIIRMPDLSSNMPSKIFYASLGDESLRIVRSTTELESLSHHALK